VEDTIDVATSSEDVSTAKPSPDLVRLALERSGVGPDEAVMVGDSVWDVKAAAAANVACVGVLSGGISADVLREAGAAAVYSDVGELLASLDQSLLGEADQGVRRSDAGAPAQRADDERDDGEHEKNEANPEQPVD